ncbi:hypothetical protein [Mycolicibacillus parakoreensis]|uniref:Transmembrane protein n=1 Tax=Mycolicibacillus parakoreensis TaxID=1069221 RepID=A0ABY3U395_9MYCO|nr:hypothetical protein [Mycolicibacillus parakoreensis]ULN52017.1 hypothetical protein MIU77_14235 [Mycolicibacillus parakoreensis]
MAHDGRQSTGNSGERRSALRNDPTVRAAARFALLVAAVGVAVLIVASLWASGCDSSAAPGAACGAPQRIALALAAPAVFFAGAIRAFVRTYRRYRDRQPWWGWQGAGWFLLMLCFAILFMAGVPIAGPAVLG